MQIKNLDVDIVKGDITELAVDVLVNPASPDFAMESGLAGLIKSRGGQEIEEQAKKQFSASPEELIRTDAGALLAKNIVHVVSVDSNKQADEHSVRRAYAQAIAGANYLEAETIAIPAIGCGTGGFPAIASAKIATQEIFKYVKRKNYKLKKIIFCLFEESVFHEYENAMRGYIDHIQNTLGPGPYVTVDIIIERPEGIVIIERSNPPLGWALPGGFLDYGESLEEAARREAREETNLDLEDLKQFHTYSEPGRDPRFQTISTVFIGKGVGVAQFGDDAKGLKIVSYDELKDLDYAFDHKLIIMEYLEYRKSIEKEPSHGG